MKALDQFGVHVMHGVTGSGKTDVYLRAIAAALNRPLPPPTTPTTPTTPSPATTTPTPTPATTPSPATTTPASTSTPTTSTTTSTPTTSSPATTPITPTVGGDGASHCAGTQVALPQVLVLVPEISLAPQWLRRLQEYIDVPAAITHYKVGDKLRAQAWADAVSGRVRVLIGTRSSVFIPFANLRLIVLDEEHAHLYKEADKGSYHARDVAVWRAQRLGIPVVLGSATPSCTTWRNLGKRHFHLHSLPKRVEDIGLPRVGLIDLRAEPVYSGFSRRLLERMRHCLDGGRQVMIYHNSRGYAPALYCTPCERVISCRNCKLALHVHKAAGGRGRDFLWCHRCLARASMARGCPDCGGDQLSPLGISTQQIEQVVRAKFSEYTCLRLDSDSISTSTRMQSALREIHEGRVQILIGTQMLVKGHHFPGVGLVAVLQPDAQLFSSDLYARERLVQDLVQVSGRAGREQLGEVAIQTRYPDEPLYAFVRTHNYLGAMQAVLDERRAMQLPPYVHLAIVRFADAHEERLLNRVRKLEQRVRAAGLDGARSGSAGGGFRGSGGSAGGGSGAGGFGGGSGAGGLGAGSGAGSGGAGAVQLYAPVLPAVTYYRRLHRAQAWLLATSRPALGRALDQMISVCRQENIPSWSVDIDPVSAE
ncbi:MAG: primosomal protein N' [Gammaproteobacteria bacterium]|nr:primosomal protein N' [Gammaproteobacteria bacterium]